MLRRVLIVPMAPVLAVLLAWAAGGADAAESPPPHEEPPAICAEGELIPHTPRVRPRGGTLIVAIDLTGWIKACADADPDEVSRAKLTWARYDARKYGWRSGVEPFPAGFGRVDLTREFRFIATPLADRYLVGAPFAACMVTGPLTRVACFSIGSLDDAGRPRVAPIPTDHPSVVRPVRLVGPIHHGDPSCPACV